MAVTTSVKRTALSGVALSTLLTLTHTTNDAFPSMLAALLPTVQVRFSLSETVLALLVATLSFSSSVLQPLFGVVADRVGRRLVGALGVITASALLSLIAVAPSVWLLVAALVVGGLGSAAFHPAGSSLARSAGGRNKALAMGIFSAGGTLGLAIGPVAVLYVIANYGIGFTPWLMVPGVLLGALMYVMTPAQTTAPEGRVAKLFDAELLAGPVGMLCLSGVFRSVSFVTFTNAMPLYLVAQGLPRDSVLIGYTLAAFSAAAGVGGIIAGLLGERVGRQMLITGTMLMALPVLIATLYVPVGSPLFFVLVMLSGALVNGGLPLMVVSAQDLAPHAVATASGLLMGFTWGTAGVLYIGIGRLQELFGLSSAMSLSYTTMIPGALLAFYVLRRYRAALAD